MKQGNLHGKYEIVTYDVILRPIRDVIGYIVTYFTWVPCRFDGQPETVEDGDEIYLPITDFEIYDSGRIWADDFDFSNVAHCMIAEGTSSTPVVFEPTGFGQAWRGFHFIDGQSSYVW